MPTVPIFLAVLPVDQKINLVSPKLILQTNRLREKCPNTEFFLVGIFPYSDWIQENTDQKKPRICTLKSNTKYFEIRIVLTSRPEAALQRCYQEKVFWKSHFGMDVLLYISCIFSEHLFFKASLEGCFWYTYLGICQAFRNCIFVEPVNS